MSVYQQNVRAFIEVLQSDLIPEPDKKDLIRSVNNWPEDGEQICEEIEKWLEGENRGRVLAAYDEKLRAIVAAETPTEMGPGNTHSNTPPDQPGETLKELLSNPIRPIYSSLKSSESEETEHSGYEADLKQSLVSKMILNYTLLLLRNATKSRQDNAGKSKQSEGATLPQVE